MSGIPFSDKDPIKVRRALQRLKKQADGDAGKIYASPTDVVLDYLSTKVDNATLAVVSEILKVKDGGIGTTQLANLAVTVAKLANDAVETAKIKDLNVTTAKIALLAITTALINDLAVTTGKLADGAVSALKLATDAVTTAKILDLNVTTGKINDLAVTAGKIASDAVTTAKILDGNVTTAKLADGAALAEILDDDGTGSGLDADLLDGQQGAYYKVVDSDTTAETDTDKVLRPDGVGGVEFGDIEPGMIAHIHTGWLSVLSLMGVA